MHQSLQSVQGESREQTSALRETDSKISQIARRIRLLHQSLERQRQRMEELEQKRADSSLTLDQHRQTLQQQIKSAYILGQQEKIRLMLNQQDPALASRAMIYYDYLNKARLRQIELINRDLIELAAIERTIKDEESRLQQLLAKEEHEQHDLELAQEARHQIIAGLNDQLQDQGKALKKLETDEKQLHALVTDLQAALVDIPLNDAALTPFNQRKGQLAWPAKGSLGARFGASRDVGKLRWDGVFIRAPEGREVRSIHYGRVAFADWLRGFGFLLIIDHGNGYMSLYGFNQSLFKETGEWVEPGEVIAQAGSSGGNNQSGIYFGIRHDGKPLDPEKWCQRIHGSRI